MGDFKVTYGEGIESFAGFTALGSCITITCMYVAYRKKEKIKAVARAAREAARRGSVTLARRLSMSGSEMSASIRRHSIKIQSAMITGSKNRTVPAIEGDRPEEESSSSSSSDFEKRQERIKAEQNKKNGRKFRKTWRGHEDSILDKVRKTKEGFFKD